MLEAADVVVTMGCGDTCPVLPGRRYEEWKLPDPAGQPVELVRPIRDASKIESTTPLSSWASPLGTNAATSTTSGVSYE